jgi:hypothetical protein
LADIRAILALEPVPFAWNGHELLLKRPNLVDLCEAVEVNSRPAAESRAWALARHLLDSDGRPLFASPEAASACPSGLAAKAIPAIEALYSEGVD